MIDSSSLLVVLGPTASGKTELAVKLAGVLSGEIISADSRQVFKGMDIGTGKDLKVYSNNERAIPYHLIDIREAGTLYNVNEFKEDFYTVFNEIIERKTLPILCGGTGMYINSILQQHEYTAIPVNELLRESLQSLGVIELRQKLDDYPVKLVDHADRSSHKRMIRAIEIASYLQQHELIKKKRPDFNPFVVGLNPEIPLRRNKVINRLEQRLNEGMVEEVEKLISNGVSKEILTFYGLEYKFIVAYLDGEMNYDSLKEKLSIAICQYAKRQMTFFRKMEKDGVKIHWFDTGEDTEKLFAKVLSSYNLTRS